MAIYSDDVLLKYLRSINWDTTLSSQELLRLLKGDADNINRFTKQKLMNFDLRKLEKVKFSEYVDPNKIGKEYFEIMAKESLHGFDNSLYGRPL